MTEEVSERIEIIARKLAAGKMGLMKDTEGERLPDELWKQMIPAAIQWLEVWDLIPAKNPTR